MLSDGELHENSRAEKHTFHTDVNELLSVTLTLSFRCV